MIFSMRCAVVLTASYLVLEAGIAAQSEPIRLIMEPATIKAAPTPSQYVLSFGTLGTEMVTLTLLNQGVVAIEFPEKRWLVIEHQSETNRPVFTPPPPYTPLTLNPTEKLTIPWRLRDPADVHLASGTVAQWPRVYAGNYRILIYYRYAGESIWRQHTIPLHVAEDSLF